MAFLAFMAKGFFNASNPCHGKPSRAYELFSRCLSEVQRGPRNLFVDRQCFVLSALGVSEGFRGAFFGDVLRSAGR